MRSTRSATANGLMVPVSALAGQNTLLGECGHQYPADVVGSAVGRAQVHAARDPGPDQSPAGAIDGKHIGLVVGPLLGLDIARPVDRVPIAVIAPAPAEADARIAGHIVAALAGADEVRCYDPIEPLAGGHGGELLGARGLIRENGV